MLTNAAARAAGARARAYKLHDQGGMHLLVRPTGTKSWQQKYRWPRGPGGREKLLTIGQFPEINVARARILQAEAKDLIGRGVDPVMRRADNISQIFERLARAWYRHNLATWSKAHAADVLGSLERDVFPALGARPIGEIAPPELLRVLRSIERRGNVVTAQRVRQRLQEIFAFGVAEGLCSSNPAASLGAAMREAPQATPHPALTSLEECRALLASCEQIRARPITRLASRFLALTAVRLDSVRGMRWGEVNFDDEAPVWRVPPVRLKLKRAKKEEERFEHLVPLSQAAFDVLSEAALCIGYEPQGELSFAQWASAYHNHLVFHGRGGDKPIGARPIGESAIGELYKRSSFAGRHVPHGWRASFSTIMNEDLGEGWRAAIDATLGHAKGDKVEAAYNRSQLLDRRRAVLERWAQLLA